MLRPPRNFSADRNQCRVPILTRSHVIKKGRLVKSYFVSKKITVAAVAAMLAHLGLFAAALN